MSAYIRPIGGVSGHYSTSEQSFPVQNGTTINQGDFVQITAGFAAPATTGRILGTAAGTVTGNAAGTVNVIVLVDPLTLYLVPSTTALAQSNVGQYFNLQGGTGAQLVNTSSASNSSGQLVLMSTPVNINPVQGNTSYGAFAVAQSFFAVA